MSETQTKDQPRVGPDSKPGKRFFITKFPELRITIKPADVKDVGGQAVQVKGQYVTFKKMAKPYDYKGKGFLNTESRDEEATAGSIGDKNDPVYWGLVVLDGAQKNEKAAKADQEIIEFLRTTEYYARTHQDNQPERMPWLKELDWDPMQLLAKKGGAGPEVRGGAPEPSGDGIPPRPGDAEPGGPKARTGLKK